MGSTTPIASHAIAAHRRSTQVKPETPLTSRRTRIRATWGHGIARPATVASTLTVVASTTPTIARTPRTAKGQRAPTVIGEHGDEHGSGGWVTRRARTFHGVAATNAPAWISDRGGSGVVCP